ncbi:hypothetical protein BCD67_25935 [Oscillatoriales cyanobacterium USR001]|nr:hypothetical protein BCD67_25935 [Oscillatoriales cyanobacterium USR001]
MRLLLINNISKTIASEMTPYPRIKSIKIQGYKSFRDCTAPLEPLEIIVGANGSGKSNLFEFLKFFADSMESEIPNEIIKGSIGQRIFHLPGSEKFQWDIKIDTGESNISYQGELMGPRSKPQISFERVESSQHLFMDMKGGEGVYHEPGYAETNRVLNKRNQLTLRTIANSGLATLTKLQEYISGWKFYSSFNIANHKIRKSVILEQEPVLDEDAGNLSSVLHYLMTEHRAVFDELQQHLQSVIPGFKGLTVKARGGPGEVIAFWQEKGIKRDLSLADLSDGILRLICWICLCLHPKPPSLICIDEPDQGVHPRTLPLLAGLFEKAAERTQVLLATHSSYFLTQFDISQIAVMRKENGESKFIKPGNSQVLTDMLEDFGTEEIEKLHRSDELELLP